MRAIAPTIAVSVAALALTTACTTAAYDIVIESRARPKMDVSAFQRVFVAGFVAGGIDEIEIETDVETTRLLRSQFRSRTSMPVVGADMMALNELAASRRATDRSNTRVDRQHQWPKNEKDLGDYSHILTEPAFWKDVGEEYQQPLIVTGTVLLQRHERFESAQNAREWFDAEGRRDVSDGQTRELRTVYTVNVTVYFIDGRTGQIMSNEHYQQEQSFSRDNEVPALSAYFELMDRVVPDVLRTVSVQPVRGLRVFLK